MTICDVCKKDVRVTKGLTLIHTPPLCEDCFEYIILDENNHETHIDEDIEEVEQDE